MIVGQDDWAGSRDLNNGLVEPSTNKYVDGPVISWEITYDDDTSLFTYTYSMFDGDEPLSPSHFLLQISDDYDPADDDGFAVLVKDGGDWTPEGWSTGSWEPGHAASNLPVTFEGLKVDTESEAYRIVTERGPMWGDFFWKKGSENGGSSQDAWNAGLVNDSPTEDTDDFTDWIPVPNEHTLPGLATAPTPAAAPMGALLLGILAMRRGPRRR